MRTFWCPNGFVVIFSVAIDDPALASLEVSLVFHCVIMFRPISNSRRLHLHVGLIVIRHDKLMSGSHA